MVSAVDRVAAARAGSEWTRVCPASRLTPERGVAALVDGDPVAVFLLSTGELAAIDNRDPCSGASVLSRGLVGEVDGAPTVASPMYKQRFELRTGRCLDDPGVSVRVHDVRLDDGFVVVRRGG
ncbi:MAG TPA: nitrite reductase small subunit NirD [Acidimicrobiia bacterium]|nr:nitrite reductase small subunit NirD [Acidimicrobiia bacterium]